MSGTILRPDQTENSDTPHTSGAEPSLVNTLEIPVDKIKELISVLGEVKVSEYQGYYLATINGISILEIGGSGPTEDDALRKLFSNLTKAKCITVKKGNYLDKFENNYKFDSKSGTFIPLFGLPEESLTNLENTSVEDIKRITSVLGDIKVRNEYGKFIAHIGVAPVNYFTGIGKTEDEAIKSLFKILVSLIVIPVNNKDVKDYRNLYEKFYMFHKETGSFQPLSSDAQKLFTIGYQNIKIKSQEIDGKSFYYVTSERIGIYNKDNRLIKYRIGTGSTVEDACEDLFKQFISLKSNEILLHELSGGMFRKFSYDLKKGFVESGFGNVIDENGVMYTVSPSSIQRENY